VSFTAIIVCVASQREFFVVVVVIYFVFDSFRKLLNTPSYSKVTSIPKSKTSLALVIETH
jgi:hypothetical protein